MATGSSNLTTYYAKRIIGDSAAATAASALLQTGANVSTSTWILNRTNRAAIYGINYQYDNSTSGTADKIEFYGGYQISSTDTPTAWVRLDTGDFYIKGKVGIGYNPNTSGNSYKLYVDGSTFLTNTLYFNGTTYYINNSGTANLYALTVNSIATFKDIILINSEENIARIYGRGTSNTSDWGYFGFARNDPGDGDLYYDTRFRILNYSYDSTDNSRLSTYEYFELPSVSADLETSVLYNILTTKNTITVGQGGTGTTTFTSGNLLMGAGTNAITTIAKDSNNTASTVVVRDASGNFKAGSITLCGGDLVLGTNNSSSNDSSDLCWQYGNGQEKMRIWSANDYTAKAAPNFREYKSDGTSLYSGCLVLGDGTGASGKWSINITGHADSDLALSGGTMTGDIKGNSSVALGTTANPFHNIVLGGTTTATMTADSTNPRITFQEGTGTQPVHLIYTDLDNYRAPAGLKVIGGTSATPAWFEVEGNIYTKGDGIYYIGTQNTYRMIRWIDNTADVYGNGISIGGGGLAIFGSGESADTMVSNLGYTGGSEVTVIASDGNIRFFPGNNSYDASAELTMSASRFWAGVNGNTAREAQVGCQSGAGQIYLWSHAATSGSRGLYVPAHGTGGATAVINVNTNNYVEFSGHIISPDASVSYIAGAQGSNAGLYAKKSSGSRWYPAVTLQTSGGGAWQIGNYNDETLEFQYATAANISSSNNSTSEIYMQNGDTGRVMTSGNYTNWCPSKTGSGASGSWGISVTGSAGSVAWTNITSNPGIYANDVTSHGNIKLTTARGGYYGINFGGNNNNMTALSSGQHNGLYVQAKRWFIYYDSTNDRMALFNSGTTSGYGLTINTNTYAGGMIQIQANTYPSLRCERTDSAETSIYWKNATAGWAAGIHPWGVGAGVFAIGQYAGTGSSAWRFKIDNSGYCYASSRMYNAVWNDFAEFRESNYKEPGRVVVENGFGALQLCNTRLAAGARVISDTYGSSVGYSLTQDTPIGIGGRVLAYTYRNRNEYKVGDAVCSAPNGTIDIMTREEIKEYPDRIIGIVSEIPTYEVWTQQVDEISPATHVEVKGRIWIYVR